MLIHDHIPPPPGRYLKSEMHDAQYMLRFAVILEAYLKGCGEAMLVGRHARVNLVFVSDSNTSFQSISISVNVHRQAL